MLLGAATYDPAAAVSKATSSLLAMTALDTTNLRITFTVPDNGCVLVRLRCVVSNGAATAAQVLLGCLEGSTLRGRLVGRAVLLTGGVNAAAPIIQEALYAVSGLTPGASLTWDAAYGVEIAVASSNLKYGGPNNTTVTDAWGAACFEIYDAPNLLAAQLYDPAAAVTASAASRLAMTALDTANLRNTFVVPPSGNVYVRLYGVVHGATTYPVILLGVLEAATVRGRQSPIGGLAGTNLATTRSSHLAEFVVTGLTAGQTLVWDAAYGVEILLASTGIKYGGPNDTTTDNAFGAFGFEVWAL